MFYFSGNCTYVQEDDCHGYEAMNCISSGNMWLITICTFTKLLPELSGRRHRRLCVSRILGVGSCFILPTEKGARCANGIGEHAKVNIACIVAAELRCANMVALIVSMYVETKV